MGIINRFVLAAALLVPQSGLAADVFLTGNKLYSECTSSDNLDQMHCLGYQNGIADVLSGHDRVNGFQACLPGNGTVGQVMDVVVKSLRDHPEDRHLAAAVLVAAALAAAFPC